MGQQSGREGAADAVVGSDQVVVGKDDALSRHLELKIASSDPSQLSSIELRKSLNFLKNQYVDRTKQLNTMRANEKAVV